MVPLAVRPMVSRAFECRVQTASHAHRKGYSVVEEFNIDGRFRHLAPSRHSPCPAREDFGGWLTLMRHYGLPTRLLDWTQSALVAAFFAVSHEDKPGPAHIWALAPACLNEGGIVDMHFRQAKEVIAPVFHEGMECAKVVASYATEVDLRMLLQQAVFTIHGVATALEDLPNAERCLVRFVVPEDSRSALSKELRLLGIRVSSIYPDLTHLGLDLEADWR